MPKKPKPKQQRRREPEALDEQEVREGTRRGLKRHADAPQQGVIGSCRGWGAPGQVDAWLPFTRMRAFTSGLPDVHLRVHYACIYACISCVHLRVQGHLP